MSPARKEHMESEFEYLDIVFENCDYVRIYPNDVLGFSIDGITGYRWSNLAHQYIIGKHADKIFIHLKNSALVIKTHFETEYTQTSDCNAFPTHLDVHKDITNIEIKAKEDLYVSVPWKNEHNIPDCEHNKLQVVKYGEEDFTITINGSEA